MEKLGLYEVNAVASATHFGLSSNRLTAKIFPKPQGAVEQLDRLSMNRIECYTGLRESVESIQNYSRENSE